MNHQDVNIIGLGYVGFPAALIIADVGHRVHGVDINEPLLLEISKGRIPFPEEGMQELFDSVRSRELFTMGAKPKQADVHLIAVPTPITTEKAADLSYVEAACKALTPVLKKGDLVLVESTISPGAVHECVISVLETSGLKAGRDFGVAYCPERVLPGNALYEMRNNDRVVGGIDEKSRRAGQAFYQTFVKGQVHTSTAREAEMVKLIENAYRDVNIAFANEIDALCQSEGIDSRQVIKLANLHPRVNILQPGPGVGGHCIPIDPWFLVHRFQDQARLLRTARETNDARPGQVVDRVGTLLNGKSRVCVLGVTYKPNVSDVRESPSLEIVELLRAAGHEVRVCDPLAKMEGLMKLEEAVKDADLLLTLVRHDAFLEKDRPWYLKRMNKPEVLDIGNFWPDFTETGEPVGARA